MKLFFIIGMRRSGTSVLRDLMLKHSEISDIEFEPHPLWFAVDMNHFARFKNIPYVQHLLAEFKRKGSGKFWHGAKFALNPGLKALEWQWLPITFPEARFIFINRNPKKTYRSYFKQDKIAVRGYLHENIYYPLFTQVANTFRNFKNNNPKMACFIQYEALLSNPDDQLKNAWDLLNLKPLTGLQHMIRQPEFK